MTQLFSRSAAPRTRLHIGAGRERLEGWTNVDIQALPGVDVVADVTKGLQFSDVEAIFAEHFLEHLAMPDAISFLLESHRVLGAGGWIRLSTPNLDWVWTTHYRLQGTVDEKHQMALALNRAFHGWGHRFLYSRAMLRWLLEGLKFDDIRFHSYGESARPECRSITARSAADRLMYFFSFMAMRNTERPKIGPEMVKPFATSPRRKSRMVVKGTIAPSIVPRSRPG